MSLCGLRLVSPLRVVGVSMATPDDQYATSTSPVRLQFRHDDTLIWEDYKENGFVVIFPSTVEAFDKFNELRDAGDTRLFRYRAAFAQRHIGDLF